MTMIFIYSALSISLLISSNPITILIVILMQTMILCLLIWTLMKTSWFSFILFLIFLGGLMVLFIYIVSLASNEKFELNFKKMSFLGASTFFILTNINFSSFFNKFMDFMSFHLMDQTMMIFSNENTILTMLIMIYLFFTLIVVIKVSSKYQGPLRNFI